MTAKTNDQYIFDALKSIKIPLEKFVVEKLRTRTRDIQSFLKSRDINFKN